MIDRIVELEADLESLYVERLGYDDDNINNIEEEDSMNRCDKLVERFFNILEEGGEYVELFLIRDLLFDEYINNRGCSYIEIIQIDDIIESNVTKDFCEYLDSDNAEYLLNEIYKAIEEKEIERAFELVNAYGDMRANVYAYYCVVRELERVTGETLIELCL